MTDEEAFKQAVDIFHNLSGEDTARLGELNSKIQSHSGKWGVRKGGDKMPDGATQMYWVENDPLIYEFLDFMDDKNLLIIFDLAKWDDGSKLFVAEDPTKYDKVDIETALKLIYAATRKERFNDGTLAWAFEFGGFVKLVNRLVALKQV